MRDFSLRFLKIGIGCLFVFPLFWAFAEQTEGYNVRRIVCVLLLYCAVFFTFTSSVLLRKASRKGYGMVTKIVYGTLMLWCLVIILRSVSPTLFGLNQLFNGPDASGPWMLPALAMVGGYPLVWNRLNSLFVKMMAVGAVLALIIIALRQDARSPFSALAFSGWGMLGAAGFLLLTWDYQKGPGKVVGIVSMFAYGLVSLVAARRHAMFSFVYLLSATGFARVIASKRVDQKIINLFIVAFVAVSIVVAGFVLIASSSYMTGKYDYFVGRLAEDNRSKLLQEFVKTIQKDTYTFVTGTGVLGTYTSYFTLERKASKRRNIENGYAQLVLKGGLVMLGLFLLTTVPAVVSGIFLSRNGFTRACGFLVFGRLCDMVFYGLPYTDLNYAMFWLCVGACLNRTLRRMEETEILQLVLPGTGRNK